MKIICVDNYSEMSRKVADLISTQIKLKPNCVLGLATGSTPIGIYNELVIRYRKGELDFSKVTTINLDEYRGIPKNHPQSYFRFMQEKLFSKVNINLDRTYIPDGMQEDTERACKEYNKIIDQVGGIDLQLLGLGHNGHIGFNEPGTVFEAETHLVNLKESTIKANQRFFKLDDKVPKQAYTMGIRSIMQAKKIVLVVNGSNKAQILKDTVCGDISPKIPASVLQLHNDVTIVADVTALQLLNGLKNSIEI